MYSANITWSSGDPFLDVPNSTDHLKTGVIHYQYITARKDGKKHLM
jgi:hypothetical protein